MKRKRSLWKFLREELESERGDLAFLLMILIPTALAAAVLFSHYVLNLKIGDIIEYVSSASSQMPESDQKQLNTKLFDLQNIESDKRGEYVTKP